MSKNTATASPRAAARDGAKTRRRLLEAAAAALERDGESRLRVSEIAREAGVATAMIYHHFGDRDSLVAAAHLLRFEARADEDLDRISGLLAAVTTADELRQAIRALVSVGQGAERREARWSRVEMLAAARRRPELAEALSRTQAKITQRLEELLARSQAAGVVDPAIDPHAYAVFVQAYTLGRIVADVDRTRPLAEEAWLGFVALAVTRINGPA